MSDQTVDPNVDPYGYLGMARHSNGSVTRLPQPSIPVDTSSNFSKLVVTKDLAINTSKNTWARLILPRQALVEHPSTFNQLPLVVYIHGGGFIVASVDSPSFQDFYAYIASEIPAVVVSIEYRRAPEYRLPVAYEDCMEAFHWIKNKPDEWLVSYADYSKCFLMGTSAGGNVAYHLGLSVAKNQQQQPSWIPPRGVSVAKNQWENNIKPLNIRGLILHQPFFGGNERTESELRLAKDKVLPLTVSDIMWELALPEGADRDHEYSNPTAGIKSNPNLFDQVNLLGWKVLVTGCDGDPLIDRQVDLVRMLREYGVPVVERFTDGGFHGLELVDFLKGKEFFRAVKEFVTAA